MAASLLASSAPFFDWTWVRANSQLIESALGQHAELSAIVVGTGLGIALPLALLAWRFHPMRPILLGFSGLLYTIPSLALFVLIQPITGYFTLLTAEVALVGYTLLILVRNILTGLDSVTDEIREATQAMGYSPTSAVLRIYLPLSLPALFAGLRVATVTVIGLVTITAFIGRGGLGQLIITGFENSFYTEILVGLGLSIVLAAIGDATFVALERTVVRWSRVRN